MSKEAECSGFYTTIEDSGGWWKEYPILHLKRWNAVNSVLQWRGVKSGGKSIPILHLKIWSVVDSAVQQRAVGSNKKRIIPLYLKIWNMVNSVIRWILVKSNKSGLSSYLQGYRIWWILQYSKYQQRVVENGLSSYLQGYGTQWILQYGGYQWRVIKSGLFSTSRDIEYGGFCNIANANGEQQKMHYHFAFKKVE